MRRGVSVVIALLSSCGTAASAASTNGPLLLEGPIQMGPQTGEVSGVRSPGALPRVDVPNAAGGQVRRNEIVAAAERRRRSTGSTPHW
jgi:hypothetical protein